MKTQNILNNYDSVERSVEQNENDLDTQAHKWDSESGKGEASNDWNEHLSSFPKGRKRIYCFVKSCWLTFFPKIVFHLAILLLQSQ